MLDIEEHARELAAKTGEPYMAWLEALSEAKDLRTQAGLAEESLLVLARAGGRPVCFSLIMEALSEYAKEHPDGVPGFTLLTREVDESSYGLADWLDSLEYFYAWLAQHGRVAPGLPLLLQYLSCCVEAGRGAPADYPLRGILEEMLDQYGFQSG